MTESWESDVPLGADPLARRAREMLDESAAQLDGVTLAKLHQGRNRAIARVTRSRRWLRLRLPGAALAATAALAALLLLPVEQEQVLREPPLVTEDLDLLVGMEELDQIEEIEFYDWLAHQSNAT
ncbi:MAG: hypothetical protein VX663_01805 [Pseudomonadota bacterium]|nr:hypothetical protein [Pseudomonadota bacterium]